MRKAAWRESLSSWRVEWQAISLSSCTVYERCASVEQPGLGLGAACSASIGRSTSVGGQRPHISDALDRGDGYGARTRLTPRAIPLDNPLACSRASPERGTPANVCTDTVAFNIAGHAARRKDEHADVLMNVYSSLAGNLPASRCSSARKEAPCQCAELAEQRRSRRTPLANPLVCNEEGQSELLNAEKANALGQSDW